MIAPENEKLSEEYDGKVGVLLLKGGQQVDGIIGAVAEVFTRPKAEAIV